jgi:large subunit ribosomal protein L13
MKIIDAKDAVLGRLGSYVARESLKGEEFAIVNCEQIIITGNRKNIQEELAAKRRRVGSTQKGPKVSRTSEKIVKRAIRGMLPNYRTGRGRDALKRIKCYVGVPVEFEKEKKIIFSEKTKLKGISKLVKVKEVSKWQ